MLLIAKCRYTMVSLKCQIPLTIVFKLINCIDRFYNWIICKNWSNLQNLHIIQLFKVDYCKYLWACEFVWMYRLIEPCRQNPLIKDGWTTTLCDIHRFCFVVYIEYKMFRIITISIRIFIHLIKYHHRSAFHIQTNRKGILSEHWQMLVIIML